MMEKELVTLTPGLFCSPELASGDINSVRPVDTVWHYLNWSTRVQIMACCLTAPSHYLNQCWLMISKVPWHNYNLKIQSSKTRLKIPFLKSHPDLPGTNELFVLQGYSQTFPFQPRQILWWLSIILKNILTSTYYYNLIDRFLRYYQFIMII